MHGVASREPHATSRHTPLLRFQRPAMLLAGTARSRLPPLVGILAAAVIVCVLLALLVVYLASHEPAYPAVASIATPSEVGARWHALFIAGGCVTAALLLASQALQGVVEPAVWAAAGRQTLQADAKSLKPPSPVDKVQRLQFIV